MKHNTEFVLDPASGKYLITCNTCDWKPKPKSTREIARKVAREHRDDEQ
jgi:hypothetical protein